MKFATSRALLLCVLLFAFIAVSAAAYAANPPICPHVIGWNNDINTWAQGAPWIKVIYSSDIAPARAAGAKIFYRPYEADSVNHDDGNLPTGQTGSQFADLVWTRLSSISPKPEAIAYRNEFNWDNPTLAKRTCAEFVNYYNRLRTLGYTGKIIFGSFGVGWIDSAIWDDTDVRAATDIASGIETHEYFDLEANCCAPWLCFRHKDIAIADHPDHLGNKEWWIGEFGSDHVCGNCTTCDDDQCRVGWQDRGKLTSTQMINQCSIYRAGCANQVQAVFLFQQGAGGWAAFEVIGTPVAAWMQTTWAAAGGTLTGNVKATGGANLSGATVTLSSSGGSATTDASGNYTITNVTAASYTATASKSGYNSSNANVTITSGQTTTQNYTLSPVSPGTITGTVKTSGGTAISGATVSTNIGGYTTTTNSSGVYTLSSVTPDTYNVTASKSGYESKTNASVVVSSGATTTSNFTLATTGSNIVTNGGFENGFTSGVGTGWTAWTSAWSNPITFADETTTKRTGSHAQRWGRSDNQKVHGGVYQRVTVVAGRTYRIVSYLRFSATDPGAWLEMGYDLTGQIANAEAGTVNYTKLESGGQNNWLVYTRDVVATGTTLSIFCKFGQYNQSGSGPSWAYADDISITQVTADTGTITGNVKNSSAQNLSGATVTTDTGGYEATTDANGNYTMSGVAAGTYDVTASKSGYNTQVQMSKTVTTGQTTTVNFTLSSSSFAAQDFESMPSWSSSYDASWGSAASWSIVGSGQSGNFLQASRSSQGSSVKALVYTVPANTTVTVSVYVKCPSASCTYWIETGCKLGNQAASDFDTNGTTWTMIKKFADTGTNGNGNVWTQYSVPIATGTSTQLTVGFKHGASGCAGPTVGWDTLRIN